jgi:methionyl-tRNA synthetase
MSQALPPKPEPLKPRLMSDPYYITTAISYPNGKPHIGHAYEAIAADAIARFHRLSDREVRFQTGTDEHGLKMVQTARDKGVDVRDLCNEMSDHFQAMCDKLNISYDRFIRTTEPAHHAACQALWKAIEANGDLELGCYEGWYSVRDEAYYDEKELSAGPDGTKLSPQGTPVEWTVEENWRFKLSNYQDKLLKLYEDHPEFIQPDSRRNEVINFVKGGLNDLSVSRTSFDWGVKVPGSPDHVMYVWLDALTNYLTGLGYPEKTPDMDAFWPASLHLIGKDVVRFHAVYWPAFLMSAGLPLPKLVYGHGFVLARGGEKMSKSLGNVVDPVELAEKYGVDQLRYFLLREVSFGQDGTYSAEAIVTRCNAELANSFGNLAQRVLSMIAKNLDGELPEYVGELDDSGGEVVIAVAAARICMDDVGERSAIMENFEELVFSKALDCWMEGVSSCNRYVDDEAPWALRKSDPARMNSVLILLFHCIRYLTILIQPIVPEAAEKLLDQLGIPTDERSFAALSDTTWYDHLRASGHRIAPPTPIFPRLEMPVETAT